MTCLVLKQHLLLEKTKQKLNRKLMIFLVLGDELANALGTDAQSLFDQNASPTKKEEEDEILKKLMEEFDIENIRNIYYL